MLCRWFYTKVILGSGFSFQGRAERNYIYFKALQDENDKNKQEIVNSIAENLSTKCPIAKTNTSVATNTKQ